MNTMRVILKSIDFISEWSGRLVSYFIYVMFVIIFYEVIARYAFNAPTFWVHQISVFFFGSYIVLGGAYVFKLNEHISMRLFYDRLSRRKRAILDLLTASILFLFIALVVWLAGERAVESFRINERAQEHWQDVIIWPFFFTLPIGAALMGLAGINKFVKDFYLVIRGKEID